MSLTVLNNLDLLPEQKVTTAEGVEIVLLKVVKAVLSDPVLLAPDYTEMIFIGDLIVGQRDGQETDLCGLQ